MRDSQRKTLMFGSRSGSPIHSLSERAWRHPSKDGLVVPCKYAAAIAVMQMGISDFRTIALAVDLEVMQVEQIDSAQDPLVRELALEGIPVGEFFKLRSQIVCPTCNRSVSLAPCLACAHHRHREDN